MTIDNSSAALKERKLFYLMTLSLTAFIPVFLLIDFFDTPVLGIPKEAFVLALSVIYVLFQIYRYILDLKAINFNDEGGKLTIKYYSLRPFADKHRTIEIPLSSFAKYTIQAKLFGRKKILVIFQKTNGKLAKYPPLSLSAMNKEDIAKLQSRLDILTTRK